MSVVSLMIAPSILMQKAFFEFAQDKKGSPIGQHPHRDIANFNLPIRIAALVHAILQCTYATFMALPLTLVAVCTVVLQPAVYADDFADTILGRITISFATALLCLYTPVATSIYTAFDPETLNRASSCAAFAPILFHAALFAFTLPSLTDIAPSAASGFARSLQTAFEIEDPTIAQFTHAAARWLTRTAPATTFLERINQTCAWRRFLGTAIVESVTNDVSTYDQAFDTTSPVFSRALSRAIIVSGEDAEAAAVF
jgi:hypothetical protein